MDREKIFGIHKVRETTNYWLNSYRKLKNIISKEVLGRFFYNLCRELPSM